MSRTGELIQRRGRIRAERYERDLPPDPEHVDQVVCDVECPRCGDWIYPVAHVGEVSGHTATEHDLRCGCLMRLTVDERPAYLLEVEALIGDIVGRGLERTDTRGQVYYENGVRHHLGGR